MDHMKLSDELRQSLIEAASWNKDEIAPRIDESKAEKAPEKAVEAEEEEVVEEDDCAAVEAHVCPLCVSQLDEALEEERVLEHLNVVLGLVDRLAQINEGEEDLDAIIDETVAEILLHNFEVDEEEETE